MDGEEEIIIDGNKFTVQRMQVDSNSATANVKENNIIIKIPYRLSKEESFSVFFNLKNRIIKSIKRNGFSMAKPKTVKFYNGQIIPVMGKNFIINISDGDIRNSRAVVEKEAIDIRLASGLSERQREKHISILSRKAISRAVLPDVKSRINELNGRHFGFTFNELKIKDQMTRWGSYSKRTNNIYLNFRLLFAPEDVMNSVIVHELAHIKEQNHSKEFWKLVIGAVPDYKEKRKWLRKNGNSLGVFKKSLPNNQEAAPVQI